MLRRNNTLFLTTNKGLLISYISDPEGCYDYWNTFLSRSKVLCRAKSGSNSSSNNNNPSAAEHDATAVDFRPEHASNPNCHFVMGGDAFDKGPGDIRLARDFISLQDRYPGRVHFVLGNRDTNKLKLRTELNLQHRDKFVLPKPYYLGEKNFCSYEKFLEQRALEKQKSTSNNNVASPCSDTHEVLLLRYLLQHRMGSKELFEFRRQELALGFHPSLDASLDDKRTRSPAEVSDAEVLGSFQTMCQPGKHNIYSEFVRRGRLAVRLGHCAFVHGSINDASLGLVPEMSAKEVPYHDLGELSPMRNVFSSSSSSSASVDDWFAALESFKQQSLAEWESKPFFDDAGHRGGAALFGYGHSRCVGDRTVEVSTYLQNGKPANVGMATELLLGRNQIWNVAVGHQPIGDTPLHISSPGGLSVFMADTNYGDKLNPVAPPNGRGKAVAEILFSSGDDDTDGVTIHGCDSQGREFCFDGCDKSELSGRQVADGWWVAGVSSSSASKNSSSSSDQGAVLLRRTTNTFHSYENKWVSLDEATKLFEQERNASGGSSKGVGKYFESSYVPPPLFEEPEGKIERGEVQRESAHKSRVKPKEQ